MDEQFNKLLDNFEHKISDTNFKKLFIIDIVNHNFEKITDKNLIDKYFNDCIMIFDFVVTSGTGDDYKIFYNISSNTYYLFTNIDIKELNLFDIDLYFNKSKSHMLEIVKTLQPDKLTNNIEIFL